MKLRYMIAVSFVFAHIFTQEAQAQVNIAPRISSFGASIRYSATPVSAGLNSDIISQSFQDVIRSKFSSDTARAGLDETMYFRLRSGGVGTRSMLRLRRMSRSQAIGLYAEKRLQITDGWSPVSKSNAPQNDLYKRDNGRIVGAQVKTHQNGDPSTYVRDMRKDNRAEHFLIPDDHYETTREHLRQKADQAKAANDSKESAFYERQLQRLGKIGASYRQLQSESQLAAKLAQARIISARVGWIITGVMVIPSAYLNFEAYYTGKITGNEFAYNLSKDALMAGAGIGGSALAYSLFKASPWRIGGIATVAVLVVQEGFLILEYGSFEKAFAQPQFWIVTSGNISGAAFGLAGAIYGAKFGTCIGSAFGPIGTGVGATVGAIAGAGTGAAIGSYGGTEITRMALDLCAPDWVYAQYDQKIDDHIVELQAITR
jgi:hypothetical protein